MRRVPIRRARDERVVAYALVDDADFERLAQHKWRLHSGGYAYRAGGVTGSNLMHNEILGRKWVDHRNGRRRDNRRGNLRGCDQGQNGQNRRVRRDSQSGLRGVIFDKRSGKWSAVARLGAFETKAEADAVVKAFRRQYMPFSEDA